MQHRKLLNSLYDLVTGDEDARVCKDIPEKACNDQPRNYFAYLLANLLTKVADELSSARLVLPWILGSLGAPAAFAGFLVPIREAGVLLPQLMVAAFIRRMAIRKWVWLFGAGLTAVSLILMAFGVLGLEGAAAGWAVIGLLVVYSLARGFCSVAAKDVLGKTVSKSRRGTLMGYSAGLAGLAVFGLGLWLELAAGQGAGAGLFFGLLAAAAALWGLAALVFWSIREQPGATEGGANAVQVALQSLGLLRTEIDFRRFVIARTLFLSIALMPPFFVLLAQQMTDGAAAGLGLMIIASGLAGSISAPIWGWLGDRSARRVMAAAAICAGLLGLLLFALVRTGSAGLESSWTHVGFFAALTVFHGGIRLGRKVYLVDMATADNRAALVAVSNTVVGVAMLSGGLVGILGDVWGPAGVVFLLSWLALISAAWTWRLPEVSG